MYPIYLFNSKFKLEVVEYSCAKDVKFVMRRKRNLKTLVIITQQSINIHNFFEKKWSPTTLYNDLYRFYKCIQTFSKYYPPNTAKT